MRTRKSITLALFVSAVALAACQARSDTPLPATSLPADTPATTQVQAATARIVVVTATWPAYPGPASTATTAPATVVPTVTPVAATQAPPTAAPTQAPATPATTQVQAATLPPTPDPNERVGGLVYEDRLDGSSRWLWNFHDDAVTFGLEDGHLRGVANQSSAYWRFTLGPDTLNNGDQQVSVTAHTVACGPNDSYGLIFRAVAAEAAAETEGAFDLYAFNVTCGGLARFETISGTRASAIVDWTASPAIQTGPNADNTLQVWMAGSVFRFYINGQYLFSAQDSRLASGTYGFYLQDRTQGGLTVTFDNLVARVVRSS